MTTNPTPPRKRRGRGRILRVVVTEEQYNRIYAHCHDKMGGESISSAIRGMILSSLDRKDGLRELIKKA